MRTEPIGADNIKMGLIFGARFMYQNVVKLNAPANMAMNVWIQ